MLLMSFMILGGLGGGGQINYGPLAIRVVQQENKIDAANLIQTGEIMPSSGPVQVCISQVSKLAFHTLL